MKERGEGTPQFWAQVLGNAKKEQQHSEARAISNKKSKRESKYEEESIPRQVQGSEDLYDPKNKTNFNKGAIDVSKMFKNKESTKKKGWFG